jgi:hypothetical protein
MLVDGYFFNLFTVHGSAQWEPVHCGLWIFANESGDKVWNEGK